MEQLIIKQEKSFIPKYEKPRIDIIQISSVDIMAMSGGDSNQGEWDPQTLNET